jgi:hypothetical protein
MNWIHSNNLILYNQIIGSLTSDVKDRLREIERIITIHNMPRRFIKVSVGNVRPNATVENEYEHAEHLRKI